MQYFRIVPFENAVLSDGILVFALDRGVTVLLPSAYGAMIKFLSSNFRGGLVTIEQLVPVDDLMRSKSLENFCQVMIDAGVLEAC